jgi:hypothetical protein
MIINDIKHTICGIFLTIVLLFPAQRNSQNAKKYKISAHKYVFETFYCDIVMRYIRYTSLQCISVDKVQSETA